MAQEVLFKWSSVNEQTNKQNKQDKCKEKTPQAHKEQIHTHTHKCKLQNQGIVFLQKWFDNSQFFIYQG